MALKRQPGELTMVTVTYSGDLDRFRKLVHSLQKHASQYPVCIIVNDHLEFYDKLKMELPQHWQVLHWPMVADWNPPLDWWSQQYFKIMISRLIQTPWYLVLDSDNYLTRKFRDYHVLRMGRCYNPWFPWPKTNPTADRWYISRLNRAFQYLKAPLPYPRHMGNSTPFMIHTQSMQSLSDIIDPEWIDGSPERGTYEFFLYFAYLVKTNTLKQLYHQSATPATEYILNSGCLDIAK